MYLSLSCVIAGLYGRLFTWLVSFINKSILVEGIALGMYNLLTILVELLSGLIIIVPLSAVFLILFLAVIAAISVAYSIYIARYALKDEGNEV